MPAPKAVLRDIADLGLDPAQAYTVTNKVGGQNGGRLTTAPKAGAKHDGFALRGAVVVPTVETPKVEPKAEAKVEKKPEPAKVDPPKVEEKAPAEPVKVEAAVEEKPAAKPAPKTAAPKVEKKEAPKAEALEAEKKVEEASKA